MLIAGLTPAWQQILVFDGFRCGDVNRAREAHWCASGKVFNAAIAACRLGGPALAVAPVGGPPRSLIQRELDQLGVPHQLVPTRAATRVCTTLIDRATGTITELVENGRPLAPEELDRFGRVYAHRAARADVAVLVGSLPQGTPDSYYRQLVEQTPCPAVLDFRGPGLLATLDQKPLVVKPNRQELARTIGRPLETEGELVEAMRSLNRRGALWVVVTEGDRPVWVTSPSEAYRLAPPPVDEVVNPIASGDAMAAGIAWATRQGQDLLDAVRFGMGAAADNLRQLLPARLDRARVETFAARVEVQALGAGRQKSP